MASQNRYILLLVIFACFPSVKGIGEDSEGSESAWGINLPSFTYEINLYWSELWLGNGISK